MSGENIDPFKYIRHGDKKMRLTAKQHLARYRFASKIYKKGMSVLDIACGRGYGSVFFPAAKYTGVDIDKEAVEFARKNNPTLEFINADARNFQTKETYDLIVSFETIEHFREYEKFLYNSGKMISSKGVLILSTPNRDITNRGLDFSAKPKDPFHTQEWNIKELKELVKKHGWQAKVYGLSYILKERLRKIPGAGRLVKALTQRVLPYSIFGSFATPNFIVLIMRKSL